MSLIAASTTRNLHRAAEVEIKNLKQRRNTYNQDPLNDHWKLLDEGDVNQVDGRQLIPAPSLFKSLATTTTTNNTSAHSTEEGQSIPTIGQCAAHLELLEVFFTLRHHIVNSAALDKTFGVKVNNRIVYRKKLDKRMRAYVYKKTPLRDTTYPDRRREKWDFYLKIAVMRFEAWIRVANNAVEKSVREKGVAVSLPHLPPVDIIMVWHAFLLNPVDFQTYCRDKKLSVIRHVEFPWAEIHRAIDPKTWAYELPKASWEWANYECQIEPDLYQYLESVGATYSPVASTLSRFGNPKEQFGSLWRTLKQMVLSERENQFIKGVLEFQVGLQQSTIISLAENVKRQASFVDKMHSHLWICSPAVGGTMHRAVDRYNKFLKLFALYPDKTLVPTLDIDLAWHTHQCSAVLYEETMRARTGRYINHDDNIGKKELGHGADETSHLFRARFGQEYSVCLCWDCEMLTSALEKAGEVVDLVVDDLDMEKLAKQVGEYVSYYRAEELSRRVDRRMEV